MVPTEGCHAGWEGEIPCDRPHRAKEKRSYSLSALFPVFFSSLRKNPAERMNYLELMVSVEPLLLVFIPVHFETPSKWSSREVGQQDMWVIFFCFQAQSGTGVGVSEVEGRVCSLHGC